MSNENKETKPNKVNKPRVLFSAQQRVQAVLSLWTERRRPSEVCQELQTNAAALGQWEDRCLSAMLHAMEPQTRTASERGPALSAKLSRLLARQTAQQEGKLTRLEKRLAKLQESKPSPTA